MNRSLIVAGASACAVLLGVNWLLLTQNRTLKSDLESAEYRLQKRFSATVGETLSEIRGRTRFGAEVTVDYQSGGPTLVYVFSPTCGYCDETWPTWHQLRSLPGVRSVAIDLTSRADEAYFGARNVVGFPVISEVDPEITLSHHFNLVPQTLLVGSDGRVLGVWTGPLDDQEVAEIRRLAAPASLVSEVR